MKKFIFCVALFIGGYLFGAPLDSVRMESKNGKSFIIHRIEQGETLYRLSTRYKVSVEELKLANGGLTTLTIGQEVFVPTEAKILINEVERNSTAEAENRYHTVAKGQTLYAVSRLYNVTVAEIKEWNNLSTNSLTVGQRVIIGKGMPKEVQDLETPKELSQTETENRNTNLSKVGTSAHVVKKRSYKPQQEEGEVSLGDYKKLNHKFSYCVHPSAPVGTIIILTCKVNDRVILVKVVANHPLPKGVMMQVNKTVFNSLSIDSATFNAEISYLD